MLATLVESRPRRERSPGSALLSVLAHAAIVGVAAAATLNAAPEHPSTAAPDPITWIPTPTLQPAESHRGGGSGSSSPQTHPLDGDRIPAPVTVASIANPAQPDVSVGASTAPFDASMFAPSSGGTRGHAGDESGGLPTPDIRPVPLPNNAMPAYPALMQSTATEARVVAVFVVDTTGHVEPGSIAVDAPWPAFADAVRSALARWRFKPALAGGRVVRARVLQTVSFRAR